jgi:inner membrane transporter RhtA
MKTRRTPRRRPLGGGRLPGPLLVLASVLSVQFGQAFGKQLFDQAGPWGVAALRLALAAGVLLLVWRPRLSRLRGSLRLVLAFGLAIAGMNLIYPAMQHLPLGVATGLQLLGPLTVALLAVRRPLDLAWSVLATLGVLLFYGPGAPAPSLVGVLLALASGVAMGVYVLLSKRAGRRTPDGSLLAGAVSCAAVVMLPVGIAESGVALLDPELLLAGAGLALVSAVLPYSLDLLALRRLPPRVVGVLESLEPAVAGVAGMVVLHEMLATTQWLALGCVTVASLGAVLVMAPEPVPAPGPTPDAHRESAVRRRGSPCTAGHRRT